MKLTLPLALLVAPALATSAAFAAGPDAGPPATDQALGRWFETLKGLEAKTSKHVSAIAWWGDSAIVSDGYTGRIRERLQARFGDAGPGFMLAAATFDGYVHAGLKSKRSGWDGQAVISGDLKSGFYGYGGVVSTSFGGGQSTWTLPDPVTAIDVYYEAIPKGGKLQLFIDGDKKSTATQDTSADTAGDKVWRFVPDQPAKSVKLRAGGEGGVRVYGVVLERGDRGVTLDALGILGVRAARWGNADADELKGQVATRAPDLLVMNFGGNEREDDGIAVKTHVNDLTKTLRAFRAGAPTAACLIVGPLAQGDTSGSLDSDLTSIYEAQRKVAAAEGCAFFDTMAVMGGKKALKTWREKKWLEGDYTHLTAKGHDHLGDVIADWLLGEYDKWKAAHPS